MCGDLRHSAFAQHPVLKVGETWPAGLLSIDGKTSPKETVWNGFCRREKIQDWLKNGWVKGSLKVDSFTEKGRFFPVPAGKRISVILLEKDRNYFNIVTRPSRESGGFTPGERAVHGRWPELEDE